MLSELAHFSGYIAVALPIVILILKTLLRLFVDQAPSGLIWARSAISAPIDIIFLAVSFLAAFLISPAGKKADAYGALVVVFIVLIVVAILVISLCRRSDQSLDAASRGTCVGLAALSYCLAVPALVFSILLLVDPT